MFKNKQVEEKSKICIFEKKKYNTETIRNGVMGK